MNVVKTIQGAFKLVAILAALTLFSCIKADDIRIVEVEEFGMETMSKPVLTIRVRNDSRRNVEILSGKFSLSTSSGKIGEVMLTEPVMIPKKSETSITIPMRVKISNPFAAASLVSGSGIDADRLRISGEAHVKSGAAKRNFSVTEAPVSQFLSIFGTSQSNHLAENE